VVVDTRRFKPCPELAALLEPALAPCRNFLGACSGIARWDPPSGHVPRGFTGGWGRLDEIDLVLVVAEPGDPIPTEAYSTRGGPSAMLERISAYILEHYAAGTDVYQRSVRRVLDNCWPRMPLYDQLRHAWVTESYLCSAPRESGAVPLVSVRACTRDYLRPQLALLRDRAIVACGKKAQERVRSMGFECLPVSAMAAPEANKPHARESWKAIPGYVASKRAARLRTWPEP